MSRGALQKLQRRSRYEKRTKLVFCTSSKKGVRKLILTFQTISLISFSRGSGRWGWVFLKRTQILSGIRFTTHFIELFFVETKRFVSSFSNVILTRQTCGQRSSRAAESKRQALGNYFCERICYMFLMSKCRGGWDLGLCTFWVLAKREPLRLFVNNR